jgi:hypothetical protein
LPSFSMFPVAYEGVQHQLCPVTARHRVWACACELHVAGTWNGACGRPRDTQEQTLVSLDSKCLQRATSSPSCAARTPCQAAKSVHTQPSLLSPALILWYLSSQGFTTQLTREAVLCTNLETTKITSPSCLTTLRTDGLPQPSQQEMPCRSTQGPIVPQDSQDSHLRPNKAEDRSMIPSASSSLLQCWGPPGAVAVTG